MIEIISNMIVFTVLNITICTLLSILFLCLIALYFLAKVLIKCVDEQQDYKRLERYLEELSPTELESFIHEVKKDIIINGE